MLAAHAFAQNVVHYTTTNANVKYLFATAEPVLHLKPGDILDTNTLDCFGNGLKKPGDTLSMATGDNPLAGPFYVEGADFGGAGGIWWKYGFSGSQRGQYGLFSGECEGRVALPGRRTCGHGRRRD